MAYLCACVFLVSLCGGGGGAWGGACVGVCGSGGVCVRGCVGSDEKKMLNEAVYLFK